MIKLQAHKYLNYQIRYFCQTRQKVDSLQLFYSKYFVLIPNDSWRLFFLYFAYADKTIPRLRQYSWLPSYNLFSKQHKPTLLSTWQQHISKARKLPCNRKYFYLPIIPLAIIALSYRNCHIGMQHRKKKDS